MKKLILAGLTAATLACAATGFTAIGANAEATYRPSTLFQGYGTELTEREIGGATYLAAEFDDGDSLTYRQDLALEWRTEAGKAFFTLELAFERKFESFDIVLESGQDSITKDKKTTNTLTFTQTGVAVNGGAETAFTDSDVTVTLSESETAGAFGVLVNGASVGEFTNIGGKYSEYEHASAGESRVPLTLKAHLAAGERETVAVKSLNGQSFALEAGEIVDNAAPVFVLSSEVRSFLLGYTISVPYQAIDVCDESVSKQLRYFQYGAEDFKTLTSSTLLFESACYAEYGKEFVSITAELTDDAGHSATYDLAWFAREEDLTVLDGRQYFSVVLNSVGPKYVGTAEAYAAYQEAVTAAAEGVTVGSNSYVYLPSLRGLIEDDDTAYEKFNFTIYYKQQNGSSVAASSGLSYDELSLAASEAGKYTIKIGVTDVRGNGMTVLRDGKRETLDASNIFDFDEIPAFTFTIYNYGAQVENAERQSSGYVGATYSASSFKINAVSGYEASYRLFYVDMDAYFAATGSYIGYADLVANPTDYEAYFAEIEAYNDAIEVTDEEWETSDNPYQWRSTTLSFVPQKTGFYVIEAEVTDAELYGVKDFGYQAIEIVAEQDVVKGDSDWLQNNLTSIVLFGISFVLLVAIICVIVIDPKEKDLDEIDLK